MYCKSLDSRLSIKRVTKMLLKVSRCSHAKHRQKNFRKGVMHVQSTFLLTRPIVVVFFHLSRNLNRLALHDFIFSFIVCLSAVVL